MLSSHTAPCRIAARPVLKKYRPLRSELRHGVHDGAGKFTTLPPVAK